MFLRKDYSDDEKPSILKSPKDIERLHEKDNRAEWGEWVDINRIILGLHQDKVLIGYPVFEDNRHFLKAHGLKAPTRYVKPKSKEGAIALSKNEPMFEANTAIDEDKIKLCLEELTTKDHVVNKHPLFSFWFRRVMGVLLSREIHGIGSHYYINYPFKKRTLKALTIHEGRWHVIISLRFVGKGAMPEDLGERFKWMEKTFVPKAHFSRILHIFDYLPENTRLVPSSNTLDLMIPLAAVLSRDTQRTLDALTDYYPFILIQHDNDELIEAMAAFARNPCKSCWAAISI